jgi:hypothetical protein
VRDSVQAVDGQGLYGDGSAGTIFVPQFTVAFTTVAARHIFYNDSAFDDGTPAHDPAEDLLDSLLAALRRPRR